MVRAKEAADSSAGRDPSGEGEDVTVDGAITGGMGRAGVSGRDGDADRDDVGTRGGTTDGAKEASGRSIGDGAAGAGEDPVAGGADTDATCVIGRGGVSGRDGVVVRGGAADDGAADGEKAGMEGACGATPRTEAPAAEGAARRATGSPRTRSWTGSARATSHPPACE